MGTFFAELSETLAYVGELMPALLSGALVTVELFILTLLFGG